MVLESWEILWRCVWKKAKGKEKGAELQPVGLCNLKVLFPVHYVNRFSYMGNIKNLKKEGLLLEQL